jgi:hypothetical protein
MNAELRAFNAQLYNETLPKYPTPKHAEKVARQRDQTVRTLGKQTYPFGTYFTQARKEQLTAELSEISFTCVLNPAHIENSGRVQVQGCEKKAWWRLWNKYTPVRTSVSFHMNSLEPEEEFVIKNDGAIERITFSSDNPKANEQVTLIESAQIFLFLKRITDLLS